MTRKKNRLAPKPVNGLVDSDAPYWRGDTAERVLEERLASRPQKVHKGPKSRHISSRTRTSSPQGKDPLRELRRLERALPRRKTLAARQRLQMRIDQLRKELGL